MGQSLPSYGGSLNTSGNAMSLLTSATGQNPPSISGVDTALTGIDALIAEQTKLLTAQTTAAQKQTKIATRQARKSAQQNRKLNRALQQSLLANPEPSNVVAPPPSLTNQEVVAASDQVRIDAAKRQGYRRSILAGNNTGGPVASNQSPSLLAA